MMQDLPIIVRTLGRHRVVTSIVAAEIAVGFLIAVISLSLLNMFETLKQESTMTAYGELIQITTGPVADGRCDDVARALASQPRVQSVSRSHLAFTTRCGSFLYVSGQQETFAHTMYGDENLLDLVGLSLVQGRRMTADDLANGGTVAMVSADFAEKMFGSTDVLGRTFRTAQAGPTWTIIGVYRATAKGVSLDSGWYEVSVVVPTRDCRHFLVRVPDVEAIEPQPFVAAVQPHVPDSFVQVRPLRADRSGWFDALTVGIGLFRGILVSVAFLPVLGVVGVTIFNMRRRRREIAIRRALGATRFDIIRLLLLENLLITAAGLTLGLVGSGLTFVVFAHLIPPLVLSGQLLIGTIVVFVMCSMAAALGPVLRASGTPPSAIFREM